MRKNNKENLFQRSCPKRSGDLETTFYSIIDNALFIIWVLILDSYDFLHIEDSTF